MISPFSHPDFAKNQAKAGKLTPCVICGKGMANDRVQKMIRVGGGGSCFLPPDAPVDPAGDMGSFPIGSDCLRKHPELHAMTK